MPIKSKVENNPTSSNPTGKPVSPSEGGSFKIAVGKK